MRAERGRSVGRAALVALVLLGTAATPASSTTFGHARLADGTHVVFVPRAGTATSFRFVVRAGSAQDPAEVAGIAHVVEHLVFHGGAGIDEASFAERVRAAGGEINAFTYARGTVYQLDAPAEALLPLVGDFVSIITDPDLPELGLAREQRIIRLEPHADRRGILGLLLDAITRDRVAAPLGTEATRRAIDGAALEAFFTQNYTTLNTTALFVGPIDPAAATAVLEERLRLPPALPEETVRQAEYRIELPLNERIPAPVALLAHGYELAEGATLSDCETFALVAKHRTSLALEVGDALASSTDVLCLVLGRRLAVVAVAFSRSLEAGRLPDELEALFAGLRERNVTRDELRLAARRNETLRRSAHGLAAPAYADLIAFAIAEYGAAEVAAMGLELLGPAQLTPAPKLRLLAAKSFLPNRQLTLSFSPMGL